MLRGARQVGKTYAVRELGKKFDNFVEINLEQSLTAQNFFQGDLDIDEIIIKLKYLTKQEIIPGKTLLFIDEIQSVPRAILALRYFYEKIPSLHVVAAGSLLDFAIEQVGVPVGRVEFLHMYPLSFLEFLLALKEEMLVESVLGHDKQKPLNSVAHEQILKLLGYYIALGGMPEVVYNYAQNKDIYKCFKTQQSLLNSYKQDFNKYGKKNQIKYLDNVFKSLPTQLGKKFKYSSIEGGFKKRELSPCLDLLVTAGIVNKVYRTDAQGIPLGAQSDLNDFKTIFLDIGLAQAALGLNISDWFLKPDPFVNKGEIIEAFIGQEIIAYSNPTEKKQLFYWAREGRTSQAEVDYVENVNNEIVPIEVKSGSGTTLKSMHLFFGKTCK